MALVLFPCHLRVSVTHEISGQGQARRHKDIIGEGSGSGVFDRQLALGFSGVHPAKLPVAGQPSRNPIAGQVGQAGRAGDGQASRRGWRRQRPTTWLTRPPTWPTWPTSSTSIPPLRFLLVSCNPGLRWTGRLECIPARFKPQVAVSGSTEQQKRECGIRPILPRFNRR